MNETAPRFWQLLGWVLALSFQRLSKLTLSWLHSGTARYCLAASLSQVVAQSVILFINRVKPALFSASLIGSSPVFAFHIPGSEYLTALAPFTVKAPFGVVARTWDLAYAPLIFSLSGDALLGEPYHLCPGTYWQWCFAGASNTNVWQAFGTVAWDGYVFVMQRTIGQPLPTGRWLFGWQGELATKRQQLHFAKEDYALVCHLIQRRHAVTSPQNQIIEPGEQIDHTSHGRSPIPVSTVAIKGA